MALQIENRGCGGPQARDLSSFDTGVEPAANRGPNEREIRLRSCQHELSIQHFGDQIGVEEGEEHATSGRMDQGEAGADGN